MGRKYSKNDNMQGVFPHKGNSLVIVSENGHSDYAQHRYDVRPFEKQSSQTAADLKH